MISCGAFRCSWFFPALAVLVLANPLQAQTFKTSLSKIYDPCRQPLLIRGVNAGIAFPEDPNAEKLAEVGRTGANTVRLTFRWLINRSNPQVVEKAVRTAVENHMLAMPSIWDATGNLERLSFAVDFWTQPEMVAVLRQYEDMILLNIANEAGGGGVSVDWYQQQYLQAILKMRAAGLHMPLVIDAGNYGRDEESLFQSAWYLIAHDPDRRLIFSWHPWQGGMSRDYYKSVIDKAISKRIPFILGEFSSSDARGIEAVDYQYLLQYAAEKNIGWLWWWWASGNTSDAHAMTSDGYYGHWMNAGEEVVSGSPYGIEATSRRGEYLESQTCRGVAPASAMPAAPIALQAVATQGAEVSLSWQHGSTDFRKVLGIKNYDIEVWDEASLSWRLVKVVEGATLATTIGAGGEFVYSMNSVRDPSLDYETSYQIRVGAYAGRDAVAYSEPVTVTTKPNPSICADGEGLEAAYYLPYGEPGTWEGMYQIDPQINFDWGGGSPDPTNPAAPNDHFNAAWVGMVEPQFDAEYTFYTDSDDFARVWVNGELVVNNWRAMAIGWAAGKIKLKAGERYPILVEYMEWDGNAKMSLHWASTQLKREIVPQCRLFLPPLD